MLILFFFLFQLDLITAIFFACCVQYHRIIRNHIALGQQQQQWQQLQLGVCLHMCLCVVFIYAVHEYQARACRSFFSFSYIFLFSFVSFSFFRSRFILHCIFIIRNEIGEYKSGAIRPRSYHRFLLTTISIQFDLLAVVFYNFFQLLFCSIFQVLLFS